MPIKDGPVKSPGGDLIGQETICPNCGTKNIAGSPFCRRCHRQA